MNCPKCNHVLRDDMFCENCQEFLFNMCTPPKKPLNKSQKRRLISICIITFASIVLVTGTIIAFAKINEHRSRIELWNSRYEKTYQDFLDGYYSSAVGDINYYKNSAEANDKALSKKYDDLYKRIDETMYNNICSEKNAEDVKHLCSNYSSCFPNGLHSNEVEQKYVDALNTIAPTKIAEAKQKISEGDYLEADSILDSLLYENKLASNFKSEAQAIIDSISEIVAYETPKSVSVQDLLSNAMSYSDRNVRLYTSVVVVYIDRERQMLSVCPTSKNSALGYDPSFTLEIYYGNMSDKSRWGYISATDLVELNNVKGRFKIYANRNHSGYIDATYIS